MMGQKLQELETFFHLGKMNTEEFAAARKETFNIKLIITVGAKTGQNRVNRPHSENHSTHRLALQASRRPESRANSINFHKDLILAPGGTSTILNASERACGWTWAGFGSRRSFNLCCAQGFPHQRAHRPLFWEHLGSLLERKIFLYRENAKINFYFMSCRLERINLLALFDKKY